MQESISLVEVDGKHEVVPTLGAQCIWPQHLPQQLLQPDISSMRYNLSHSLKSMQKQGRRTDLIIQVDSRTWEVHRLVLATCSPFFEQLLQCTAPGTVLLNTLAVIPCFEQLLQRTAPYTAVSCCTCSMKFCCDVAEVPSLWSMRGLVEPPFTTPLTHSTPPSSSTGSCHDSFSNYSMSPIMPKVCCGAAGQPLIVAGVTSESMDLLVDWLYGHFKESLTFDQRIALFAVSHRYLLSATVSTFWSCRKSAKGCFRALSPPRLMPIWLSLQQSLEVISSSRQGLHAVAVHCALMVYNSQQAAELLIYTVISPLKHVLCAGFCPCVYIYCSNGHNSIR